MSNTSSTCNWYFVFTFPTQVHVRFRLVRGRRGLNKGGGLLAVFRGKPQGQRKPGRPFDVFGLLGKLFFQPTFQHTKGVARWHAEHHCVVVPLFLFSSPGSGRGGPPTTTVPTVPTTPTATVATCHVARLQRLQPCFELYVVGGGQKMFDDVGGGGGGCEILFLLGIGETTGMRRGVVDGHHETIVD